LTCSRGFFSADHRFVLMASGDKPLEKWTLQELKTELKGRGISTAVSVASLHVVMVRAVSHLWAPAGTRRASRHSSLKG
jgi:hypothetical protein